MQAEDGVLLEGRLAEYRALFECSPSFQPGEPSLFGSIDRQDISDLAGRLETPLTAKQTADLIDEFCSTRECLVDGEQRITFEEFLNMFRDHMLDLQQITAYLKLQAAALPETSPEEVRSSPRISIFSLRAQGHVGELGRAFLLRALSVATRSRVPPANKVPD